MTSISNDSTLSPRTQRDTRRMNWFVSIAAAVAGLLFAVQAGQINPYMGFTPVLKAFIAAVIGGFGSIAGAVVGVGVRAGAGT